MSGIIKSLEESQTFSASFSTYEEAQEFAEKWEPVFLRFGRDAVEYDALENKRKRKWGDRY